MRADQRKYTGLPSADYRHPQRRGIPSGSGSAEHNVPPLEEYSENGIDLTSPIGIEIRVVQKEQCDVDNGLKSILDRLVDIWGLPDDNHVAYASMEKIGICEDYKDGKIMFRVYNKEG